MAIHLSTTLVDPMGLSTLPVFQLITLDKNPGVHPTGICETARSIIAEAILTVTKVDILETTGSLQLCMEQCTGAKAAVHATKESFLKPSTEVVLLINASNMFNTLN